MRKAGVAMVVLALALMIAPSASALTAGFWASGLDPLNLGTWVEVYDGGPGQPGSAISAMSSPAGQWAIDGLAIPAGGGPSATVNGDLITYVTGYEGGSMTLGDDGALWGPGGVFTQLMAVVTATKRISTGEYVSGQLEGTGVLTEAGTTYRAEFFAVVTEEFDNPAPDFAEDGSHGGDVGSLEIELSTIPEPTTLALFGLGAIGAFVARRRRKK